LKLQEVVKKLRAHYGGESQTNFSKRVGYGATQTKVSSWERGSSEIETNWRQFRRLSEMAREIGLDVDNSEDRLQERHDDNPTRTIRQIITDSTKAKPRGKGTDTKTAKSPVPPRDVPPHQGRTRR